MTPSEKWKKAQGIRRYVWANKPQTGMRVRLLSIASSLERQALLYGYEPQGPARISPDANELVGAGDDKHWPPWLRAEVARLRCTVCKGRRAWWYTLKGKRVRILAAARKGVDAAKAQIAGTVVRCRDCALLLREQQAVDTDY